MNKDTELTITSGIDKMNKDIKHSVEASANFLESIN